MEAFGGGVGGVWVLMSKGGTSLTIAHSPPSLSRGKHARVSPMSSASMFALTLSMAAKWSSSLNARAAVADGSAVATSSDAASSSSAASLILLCWGGVASTVRVWRLGERGLVGVV